jgi:two-component system chemotaxis response regulator CheB
MPRIRVLVVDDAVVFRRVVADELAADPQLEVVGTASNGKIALARLPQLNPDIVILDIEMPEMDGLTALKELRKTYRRLPVIMFSSLTERGALATLDALAAGATDYFPKPASTGMDASVKVIREQLIPKIKALCAPPPPVNAVKVAAGLPAIRTQPTGKIEIVAIGSSTGGPNALADVFAGLPRDFPAPIVIVQHMPPMFTRLLADRLTSQYALRVQEGSTGATLKPGEAWIAPGDHHMLVVREAGQARLIVNQDPPENSCRPAVDVLLRSVTQAYGPNSLSVILTGMGQDGLRGCERIREAGGQIVVQDEATSVVWGMPGYVARAGLADRVLPLSLIADEIVRRVTR